MIGAEKLEAHRLARSPASLPTVRVRQLEKRFAVRRRWRQTVLHPWCREFAWALRGIDLDVHDGECFGVLGPNGAGKTTLFKILATLILPDGGTASVGGCDVIEEPAGARRFLSPAVSDERSLNWRLSGTENLRLYAHIHRIPRREMGRRMGELLEVVGLTEAGEKLVAHYSAGMKQRLLIARALLPRPKLLLLDEPTRSLDPLATRRFWGFVRRQLIDESGCTVMLATHDPEEALALCDRITIMSRGMILSEGAPRTLLSGSSTGRYRIWIRDPEQVTRAVPGVRILSTTFEGTGVMDGWTRAELEIAGGPEHAARINTALVLQGVPVAHFERVEKTLSEYIEEVVDEEEACRD